jgi:hypothetical protein
MSRPISWLSRVHEIRRAVAGSARSHYDRRDLEALFELQPRAAQKLLGSFPTVQIGTSLLVDREILTLFLDRLKESDDVVGLLRELKKGNAPEARRKALSLVRRDTEPATLASLPSSIVLSRGRLEVNFTTVEHLAQSLYALARVLESEGDAFVLAFDPELAAVDDGMDGEIPRMFAELETLESYRGQRRNHV